MTTSVTVAVAQFAPGEDKDANLEAVTSYVTDAVAQGANLVVFPEYAMFTAPAMDESVHGFIGRRGTWNNE